jgi:hypothetical protein
MLYQLSYSHRVPLDYSNARRHCNRRGLEKYRYEPNAIRASQATPQRAVAQAAHAETAPAQDVHPEGASMQNGQAETRPGGEIERRHFFQRRMQLRIAARFQGNDEGESGFLEPRPLQNGINV